MESACWGFTANGFELPAMHAKKQARSQRSTTGGLMETSCRGGAETPFMPLRAKSVGSIKLEASSLR